MSILDRMVGEGVSSLGKMGKTCGVGGESGTQTYCEPDRRETRRAGETGGLGQDGGTYLTRARILLKSARGDSDETITLALDVGFITLSTEYGKGVLKKELRPPSRLVAPDGIISASWTGTRQPI